MRNHHRHTHTHTGSRTDTLAHANAHTHADTHTHTHMFSHRQTLYSRSLYCLCPAQECTAQLIPDTHAHTHTHTHTKTQTHRHTQLSMRRYQLFSLPISPQRQWEEIDFCSDRVTKLIIWVKGQRKNTKSEGKKSFPRVSWTLMSSH